MEQTSQQSYLRVNHPVPVMSNEFLKLFIVNEDFPVTPPKGRRLSNEGIRGEERLSSTSG